MMLHRHFEQEGNENMTRLSDVEPKNEFVSEVFPPEEQTEAPKRRTRSKKTAE